MGARGAVLAALTLSLLVLAGCQPDPEEGLSPERTGPQVLNPPAGAPL